MKTPKRTYVTSFLEWGDETYNILSQRKKEHFSRWKRKNRVAQLKRTIARLTDALTAERKQYKRTIARLTDALTAERKQLNSLWLGDHLKRFSPEWDAFIQLRGLKTPAEDAASDEKFEYWVALREVGKSVLNAACLAAMAYGEAKEKENAAYHSENAESGQQTALPPTGEQQACDAETAENAKQGNLLCTDAEQTTERK